MSVDPLKQLEEKLTKELQDGHPYEAQQYVQTFVARKKKTLGQNLTSTLVFHGLSLLLKNNSPEDAGSLIVWFIEDGDLFSILDADLTPDSYCDVDRLLELLSCVSAEIAAPFIEKLYGPLHILIAKKSNLIKDGPLALRLDKLENVFADIFESTKKWNNAYKSVLRLNDISRLASILNLWANDSFSIEKPLFFSRSIFQLLADKKIDQALELSKISYNYISEPNVEENEVVSCQTAVWHLSIILAELASLPPLPRVDKPKLFGLLMQLYVPKISQVDSKLINILEKVGPNAFNFLSPAAQQQQQAPNPMSILQNMFAGAQMLNAK